MQVPDAPELTPVQVLARFPGHDGTLASFLEARARVQPRAPAVEFEGRIWSYEALGQATGSLAQHLARRGLARGDRIVLLAANSDLSVIVFLAAARLGALFVPLNPASTDAELEYLLAHTRPALIIAQPADAERVERLTRAVVPSAQLLPLLDLGLAAASAAEVLAILQGLGAGHAAAVPPAREGDALVVTRPDDALVVIYTSGTTGFPKGVVHTQRTYLLAAEGFVARMHLQPSDRLLTVMPFFHINALFYSLGGALAAGGTLIIAGKFSASGFWNLAAASGATEFNFLAAIGNILLDRPRSEFNPRHRIRKVYGGPISERMHEVFPTEFNVPVLIEGYGMTEIPGACCNPYAGPQRRGSIGLPAVHPSLPGRFSELRVLDEDGRELPADEIGELAVRTPMMFREYLDDPQQTARAFRNGWFLTGDLVRRDAQGYHYFVARRKDIIRRRGENISGAEIDRVLSEHPDVLEAAAIGVPAELGEEELLVVIVPKPHTRPRPDAILEWCRGRLAGPKIPRYVVFADTLPYTPSHRIAKHRLKADPDLLGRAYDAERAAKP